MNLVLKCSKEDLNNLIKECIVEPRGNNAFIIYTKSDLKNNSFPLLVEYLEDNNEDSIVNELESINSNSTKTLEKWYKEFRESFPNNASKHLGIDDGTNLRTGSKVKIKKGLQKLVDEGYSLQDVINAVKYEVWFRIKQSTGSENKLEFMKRMQTWVTDINNIEVMIERSKNSVDFQQSINMENDQISKRKINLA